MAHDLTPDPGGNLTPIAPDGADPLTAASAEAFLQRLANKDAWATARRLAHRAEMQLCHITLDTGALVSSKAVLGTIVHNTNNAYSTATSDTVLLVPAAGFYWVSFNFGVISDDATDGIELMARVNRGSDSLLNCFARRWSTNTAHEVSMHASGLVEIVDVGTDGLSIEVTSSIGTPTIYAAQNPTFSVMRIPNHEVES